MLHFLAVETLLLTLPVCSLSSDRKRIKIVVTPFSKSGLIKVTLTLHLSNKLTFNVYVRAACWLQGKKGVTYHSFDYVGTLVPVAHRKEVLKSDMVCMWVEN